MGSLLGFVRVLVLCLFVSSVFAKKCNKPKVRREWRKFSDREKGAWIKAINCLGDLPHDPALTPSYPIEVTAIPPVNTSSSFYDDIVYMHMDLNPGVHFTGYFLPWHRYYVQFFEDMLKKKCGYKGVSPYWDWTLDAHDMFNSDFFDDSPTGVGGWGDPNDDVQITTGGFKNEIRAYPNPHRIRRNFTLRPFSGTGTISPFGPGAPAPPRDLQINTTMTKANVDFVVNGFKGAFMALQGYAENLLGVHVGAHLILAGDMTGFCSNGAVPPACIGGPKWTPNDPLFFMHHAFVDKIWYDWQKKDPKNKYSFGGGSISAAPLNFSTFVQFPTGLPPYLNFSSPLPGDGLWSGVQIWDVMDTTGDTLCYVYA